MQLTTEIVTFLVSVGMSYGVIKIRQDKSERAFEKHQEEVWKEISKLREWRHEHQKESGDKRLEIEKDLGQIRSLLLVRDEQYKEIIRRFDSFDKKLDEFRQRMDEIAAR